MEDETERAELVEQRVPATEALHETENRALDFLAEALHWSEVGLAMLSVAFVAVGVFVLFTELLGFQDRLRTTALNVGFEDVLSDILLLVVGIELALMLVRRTPDALIEVMFFVVARKMLIKADTFWDLVLGVAALAGLFAIRRYLEYQPIDVSRLRLSRRRAAATDGETAVPPAAN